MKARAITLLPVNPCPLAISRREHVLACASRALAFCFPRHGARLRSHPRHTPADRLDEWITILLRNRNHLTPGRSVPIYFAL